MKTVEYQNRVAAALAGFYERARKPRLAAKLEDDRARATKPKRKRRAPPVPLEKEEQRIVVDHLKLLGLDFDINLEGTYHGPNGWKTWNAQRRAGARTGRPDIEIKTRAPKHPEARGVAIEMKRCKPYGKAPSPEQLECHERLRADGWLVHVAYGADDAIAWLESLGWWLP